MVRLLTLIGLLCFSLACNRHSNDPTGTVPADFELVFGSGGGITGLWQGFTLQADGRLLRWNGPMAGANETVAGSVSMDDRRALWNEIEAAKFFEETKDERGNMTRRISVTANEKTHHVYWPMVVGTQETQPLDRLYERCEETASRASTSG